jgi:hypothetical protein
MRPELAFFIFIKGANIFFAKLSPGIGARGFDAIPAPGPLSGKLFPFL